ncbi:MAG: hypothetical protein Q8P18_16380 [Pseudomonadota bacterium]|nr:hypothetical protein [Pseudomonadota bacterium]
MLQLLLLLVSGCATSPYAGSCLNPDTDLCLEYTTPTFDAFTVRASCIYEYAAGECPRDDAFLGTCPSPTLDGQEPSIIYAYYTPGFDAASAETACGVIGGAWEPA